MEQPARRRDDAGVAETIRNLIMQHTSHPGLAYVSSANPSPPRASMIMGGLVIGYKSAAFIRA